MSKAVYGLSPNLLNPASMRENSNFSPEIVVVGAGPAGLSAALSAADEGAHVYILERDSFLGGQLVKQTHMFFGSEGQYASERGTDIKEYLADKVKKHINIDYLTGATVVGLYEDNTLFVEHNDEMMRFKPQKVIVATGAMEDVLNVENWDLPGVYGVGAVQTLMNVDGVKPGNKVIMVGAGNIGVIVSYQLIQAGVEVAGILKRGRSIGAYLVHASKVRRLGVPIQTSTTIKEIHGSDCVEGVTTIQVDANKQPISGTETKIELDTVCLSVGLSPLAELLIQAGCKTEYVPELGGFTPVKDYRFETTRKGVYATGDVAGIEEACSAIVEGQLAGMFAAESMGYKQPDFWARVKHAREELLALRRGPVGKDIREGQNKLTQIAKSKGVL